MILTQEQLYTLYIIQLLSLSNDFIKEYSDMIINYGASNILSSKSYNVFMLQQIQLIHKIDVNGFEKLFILSNIATNNLFFMI
jgi:hypothetical protein